MSPGDQKKPYWNSLESFSGSPAPSSVFLAAPTKLPLPPANVTQR